MQQGAVQSELTMQQSAVQSIVLTCRESHRRDTWWERQRREAWARGAPPGARLLRVPVAVTPPPPPRLPSLPPPPPPPALMDVPLSSNRSSLRISSIVMPGLRVLLLVSRELFPALLPAPVLVLVLLRVLWAASLSSLSSSARISSRDILAEVE